MADQLELPIDSSPNDNVNAWMRYDRTPRGLSGRLVKRDANRSRKQLAPVIHNAMSAGFDRGEYEPTDRATFPDKFAGHDEPEEARDDLYSQSWMPNIDKPSQWSRAGAKTEEVPFNTIDSAQGSVLPARVDQIRQFPGSAHDPRFPTERPLAVRTAPDSVTVMQGTHRAQAGLLPAVGQQMHLLHPMTVLNAPESSDEAAGVESRIYQAKRRINTARNSAEMRDPQFS